MPYEGGDLASGRKLFVGNLPSDISSKEMDDLFFKFGKIHSIDIKRDGKKPFAFVEFDDDRDAEEAMRQRKNYNYDGYRLTVEWPRSSRRSRSPPPRRPTTNDQGQQTYNKDHSGPSKRTDFRVLLKGVPRSGSWQDLKDHCREAGDVSFADVIREGDDERIGIVEFFNEDDMLYAIKNLNDTKFKSHEGDTAFITIEEDVDGKYKDKQSPGFGRRRDRSPPRRRSRSPRRSSYRERSRSRDRDYGRSSRRDRSRSRSPGYRRY